MALNDLNNNGIPDSIERPEENMENPIELPQVPQPTTQVTQPTIPVTKPTIPVTQPIAPITEPAAPIAQPLPTPSELEQNLAGIEEGYRLRQEAALAGALEGTKKAAEQHTLLTQQQQKLGELAQRQADQAEKFKLAVEQEHNSLRSIRDEIAATQDKEIGLFAGKSTGQQILAAISLALSGIGAAMQGRGGENKALDVLNAQVNNDLAQQRLALQRLSQKEQATHGLLGRLQSQFNNEQQALAAARIAILDNAALKTQALAAKYSAPELKQRAADFIGQIETEKNKELAKFSAISEQKQLAQQQLQRRFEVNKAIKEGKEVDVNFLDPKDRERVVRRPTGIVALADNPSAARELNKFSAEVVPAIEGAKRVLDLVNERGTFDKLYPTERAKISTELTALIGQLRLPFTGPGVLTEKEFDRLMSVIGDPNKIATFSDWEKTKLNQVIKKLSSDLKTRYKQAGIKLDENELGAIGANRNEARIQAEMAKNPTKTRDQIIAGLVKIGKLE